MNMSIYASIISRQNTEVAFHYFYISSVDLCTAFKICLFSLTAQCEDLMGDVVDSL